MPVASFLSPPNSSGGIITEMQTAEPFRHAAALVGTRGRDGDRPDEMDRIS